MNAYSRRNSLGILLAAVILLAGAAGFGGGMVASALNQRNTTGSVTTGTTAAGQTTRQTTAGSLTTQPGKPTSGEQTGTLKTTVYIAGGNILSVAEIARLASSAVVEITTEVRVTGQRMQQYIAEGAGSGVILTEDGLIVTNNHVIEDAEKITVRLLNGVTYDAVLVGTDVKTDLAVVKIEASGLTPAVQGDSDSLAVGDLAVAIGNPLGELGGTVTNGIISALDREISIDGEIMHLLQTNAAINPGNSGGGLFDGRGSLIGVVNAKSSGSDIEGLGFAIPINIARPIIEQLINYGYVQGRIDLGMTLVDIDTQQAAIIYRVSRLGVYVLKVTGGSNADKAGFASGDCILSIDGVEVAATAAMNAILDTHDVGDVLQVTIYRNRQQQVLSLTLAESKPAEP